MQGRVLPAVGACEQRAGIMEVQGTLEHSQQPWVVANRKSQGEGVGGLSGPMCTAHPLPSVPQDMRKHVTMTLLDTEQSYVESLRTLMQVRLTALPGSHFMDREPRSEVESDPGTHRPP